jgi:hypothetical protein
MDLDHRAGNDCSGWIRDNSANLFRARGAAQREQACREQNDTKNIPSHFFSSNAGSRWTEWHSGKQQETPFLSRECPSGEE